MSLLPDLVKPVTAGTARRVFLRTSVKALAFMLVAGGVGPVFLLLYVLVDVPDREWLLVIGALVTVVDVLLALLAGVVAVRTTVGGSRGASAAATAPPAQPGTLAWVELTSAAQTGARLGEHVVVHVAGVLHHPDTSTYAVERRLVVGALHLPLLHHGVLAVRLPATPDEGSDWEVDWRATAVLVGTVPVVLQSETGESHDLTGRADLLVHVMTLAEQHGVTLGPATDLRQHPALRTAVLAAVTSAPSAAVPAPPS